MPLIRLRMHLSLRRSLYSVLAVSLVTGIGFYILSRWVEVEGEFGPQKHPWQFPLLKVHGAAAFLMLMGIGAMFAQHVPAAWRSRRSRPVGMLIIGGLSFMVISAWFLYYIANDDWRPWLGTIHAVVGISLPIMLAVHVIGGRRRARGLAAIQAGNTAPVSPGIPLKDRLKHSRAEG